MAVEIQLRQKLTLGGYRGPVGIRPGLRGQTVTIGSCVSDTRQIAIGYVLLLDFPDGPEDVDS